MSDRRRMDEVRARHTKAEVYSNGRDYIVKLPDRGFLGTWSINPSDAWDRAYRHIMANRP